MLKRYRPSNFSMETLYRQYISALKSGDTVMATVYASFIVYYTEEV